MRPDTTTRLRVVALAAAIIVGLWQGFAFAGEDAAPPSAPEPPSVDAPPAPDTGTGSSAPSTADEGPAPSAPAGAETSSSSASAPAAPQVQQPEPQDDGDVDGHETENPNAPPHAGGAVADVVLLDGNLPVTAGSTYAEVDPDDGDSSRSDVTVLAVGGQEIAGAHADSESGPEEDTAGAQVACAQSGGALCVSLLFTRATATENRDSSDAEASTSLAFVCLGGTNPEPTSSEDCREAPVSAGASESESEIHKNKNNGEMTTEQETKLLNLCVGGEDPATGKCGAIGAEAVEGDSESEIRDRNGNRTTEDDRGTSSRRSCVLVAQAGGGEPIPLCAVDGEEGQDVSIPQGCPDPSLVCLFLNQGEAAAYVGGAWSRQEAIHVAFPGPAGQIIFGHLGTAESLVEGQAGRCPPGFVGIPPDCEPEPERFCPDGVTPIPPGGRDECPGGGARRIARGGPGGLGGAGLALTGSGSLPFLALSLILAATGFGALVWDRRRDAVH